MQNHDLLRELKQLAGQQDDPWAREVIRAAIGRIRELQAERKPDTPENVRDYFSTLGKVGGKRGGRSRWRGTTLEERREHSRKMNAARYRRKATEAA